MFKHTDIINKDLPDKDLYSLIQRGNERAFTIVYERYHKLLYALSYQYFQDKSMADDAVQYVFVKFWELREDMGVSISLKNYLYTMTKNYLLNQIRNQNSAILHNFKMLQEFGPEAEYYEDNSIEDKETISLFYKAINQLPSQKRIVCLLKMEKNLSNQDIADKMNISINTVKTHYAQSLKILKKHLSEILTIIIIILF